MERSRQSSYPEVDQDWVEQRRSPEPTQRLLLAVVRRAVWDFVLYKDPASTHHELALDAAGWLFWDGQEEEDEEGRYSFLYICSILGLDFRMIREHALRLTRSDIQRLNPNLKDD